MLIYLDDLEDLVLVPERLHLALGVFDGLHKGHQAVIQQAVRSAQSTGGLSFVITFFPNPAEILTPDQAPSPLIATVNEKVMMLESMGVDGVFVIEFDEEFATVLAEDFIRVLCRADVASISVGEDWRFGYRREGCTNLLRSLSVELGFAAKALPHVNWDGMRISSTRIRQAIHIGDFDAVKAMLGRDYFFSGIVVEGLKLGRILGFPTANLRLPEIQLPRDGVWVVEVDGIHRGVANLGCRPTVDGNEERLLEVHILDFEEDIYGKTLQIRFLHFLREIRKFDSLDALKAQIFRDVQAVKHIA
jgi:riboflavin kinase/FMN adenylyltransferase